MRLRMRCALLLLAVATIAIRQTGISQMREGLNLPDLRSLPTDLKSQARKSEVRPTVAMDAPVDPDEYYVGPGDVVALHIWSTAPIEYELSITPEGTLLIPGGGAVAVSDLTLAAAKAKVTAFLSKKFVNSSISLMLLYPRRISVEILGFVLNEGKQEMSAVERVENLITKSNSFPSERMTFADYEWEVARLRKEASERRILIKRLNGDIRNVDLVKYRTTKAGKHNPYLREGDVVYVPKRSDLDNAIGVFGGVMYGAFFEYAPGDSLTDLIAMSLGFKESTDPEHAVLTRLSLDASHMDTVRLDARAVIERRAPNVALRPGDRLVIPEMPDVRRNYYAVIEGEVVTPGRYPIALRGTRISQLIRAAGGVTGTAHLKAARLLRRTSDDDTPAMRFQVERLRSLRAGMPATDSAYYLSETELRLQGERVSIDFTRLLVDHDSTQDAILQPYDRVVIPPRRGTVYVFGQVVRPGHVAYVPNADYQYYIDQAGGLANDARTGDIKVVKGSVHTWLDPSETTVEDGDDLWVPREPTYPFGYYMTVYAQIAAILGAVATIALLVNSF